MKTYKNGVTGPDLEQCDIVTFDLLDAIVQFCLPKDSEYPNGLLASRETLQNWKVIPEVIHIAKTRWLLSAQDQGEEWNTGIASLEIDLLNLDVLDFESWLEVKPYCLLRREELARLAIDYFSRLAKYAAEDFNPPLSEEEAIQRFCVIANPEDLIVSKQDGVPWFTNWQKERWWATLVKQNFYSYLREGRSILSI